MIDLYDLRANTARVEMQRACDQVMYCQRDDGATMAVYAVKTANKAHIVCVIKEPNTANPLRVVKKSVTLTERVTLTHLLMRFEMMFDQFRI